MRRTLIARGMAINQNYLARITDSYPAEQAVIKGNLSETLVEKVDERDATRPLEFYCCAYAAGCL